jgi:hypothetical protein
MLQNPLRRFEERLYRWALDDFQREINQGFPLLRRVADSVPKQVIQLLRSLPPERQLRLATTLVKNKVSTLIRVENAWYATAESLLWTPEDDKLYSWYRERIGQPRTQEEWQAHSLMWPKWKAMDKQKLMRAVRGEMVTLFPGQPPKKQVGDLHYRTNLHGFEVETVVLKGHTTWQLSYYHRIRNAPLGFDVNHIGLYSWLGIGSMTYWSQITDTTIPGAAHSLSDLCGHFLKAADGLLNGLLNMDG